MVQDDFKIHRGYSLYTDEENNIVSFVNDIINKSQGMEKNPHYDELKTLIPLLNPEITNTLGLKNPYIFGGGRGDSEISTSPIFGLVNVFLDISGFLPVRIDYESLISIMDGGKVSKQREYIQEMVGRIKGEVSLHKSNDCINNFQSSFLLGGSIGLFSLNIGLFREKFLGDGDLGYLYLDRNDVLNLFEEWGYPMNNWKSRFITSPHDDICSHCDSDGDISCLCSDGTISCEECMGEGQIGCEECEGGGRITCDDCDAHGQIGCNNCDEGSNECDVCEGAGTDDCDTCDGGEIICGECDEGYNVVEGKDVPCKECDGDYLSPCGSCDGHGQVGCDNCESEGRFECVECDGHGELECGECEGGGRITCDDCEGDGLIECGNCDGGEEMCDLCDGSEFLPCSSLFKPLTGIFSDLFDDRELQHLKNKIDTAPFSAIFNWKLKVGDIRNKENIKWVVENISVYNLLEPNWYSDDSHIIQYVVDEGNRFADDGSITEHFNKSISNFSINYSLMTPVGYIKNYLTLYFVYDVRKKVFKVTSAAEYSRFKKFKYNMRALKNRVYYELGSNVRFINYGNLKSIKY